MSRLLIIPLLFFLLSACTSVAVNREFKPTAEGFEKAIELAAKQPKPHQQNVQLISYSRPAQEIARPTYWRSISAKRVAGLLAPDGDLTGIRRVIVSTDWETTLMPGSGHEALSAAQTRLGQGEYHSLAVVEFDAPVDLEYYWNWRIVSPERVSFPADGTICIDYRNNEIDCFHRAYVRSVVIKDRYGEQVEVPDIGVLSTQSWGGLFPESFLRPRLHLEVARYNKRDSRYLLRLGDLEIEPGGALCGTVVRNSTPMAPLYRRRLCAEPETIDYLKVTDFGPSFRGAAASVLAAPVVAVGATVMLAAGQSQE